MDSVISTPTYIVIDIPSPMAEKIRLLRGRFDSPRASMPAEITLTGSWSRAFFGTCVRYGGDGQNRA